MRLPTALIVWYLGALNYFLIKEYFMSDVIGYGPLHSKITTDDIQKIKAYVREGLALPQSSAQINQKFNCDYFTEEKEGITTELIEIMFKLIFTNVSKWSDIERNMLEVASRLSAFSDDLNLYAGAAIESIKEMAGYSDYLLKIKDLTPQQRDNFSMPVADEDSIERYGDVGDFIASIIKSIEEKRRKASAVKMALTSYGDELQGIEQSLGGRINGIMKVNSTARLREISAKLIEVNDRIHDLRERSTMSWWGWIVFGGPLGAALIKANRDELVTKAIDVNRRIEKDLLAEQITINRVMGDLKSLHSDLYSLLIYTRGAIEGVTQIETLWVATLMEINESKNTLAQPREWKFLHSFVVKMESVLARWASIKKNVDDLKKAFSA
jgi:hypothetical protein